MAEKQGGIVQVVSSYAMSLEQTLFHWTYAIFGASMGFLQGGLQATHRLKPHFTSTHGLKELIVGSNHVHEPQAQGSITDLLKSWIPNFSSTKSKTSAPPFLVARHDHPIKGFCAASRVCPPCLIAVSARSSLRFARFRDL